MKRDIGKPALLPFGATKSHTLGLQDEIEQPLISVSIFQILSLFVTEFFYSPLFSSVSGREARRRGEMGECHNTHLHLVWISCPQDHLVPVFWDKTHVSSKAQGSEARQWSLEEAIQSAQ